MKHWHALAAVTAASLALVGFHALGGPSRPKPRSAAQTAARRPAELPEQTPHVPDAPPPVPKAPPHPAPRTAVAVVEPPPEAPRPDAPPGPIPPGGEDTAESRVAIVAAMLTEEEKAALERHLSRFVLARTPEVREDTVLLPKADPGAVEARRAEQLELLRQRKTLKLLDHIGQGLLWLALHQGPDGKISEATAAARCAELGHKPACARNSNFDQYAGAAATALAVAAMLDFRDQDVQGILEPTLARAVAWLRGQQRKDGTFPGREYYATAISLVALGQAAASTGSEDLRKAVERGLQALFAARGPDGGYRYQAGEPGDLSVSAWVAQAVEAARRAKAEIPEGMEAGLRVFLDAVWVRDARFLYTVGGQERATLYPAGMLTHLIERDVPSTWPWALSGEAALASWRAWMKEAPARHKSRIYTTYYAVRVALAIEPELPEEWSREILALASRQNPPGPSAGSFEATLGAGTVVETALSVLTLEHALYKR